MKCNLALSVLFLSLTVSAGWPKAKPAATQQKDADAKPAQAASPKGGEQSITSGDKDLDSVLSKMNKSSGSFSAAQADFTSTTYQKLMGNEEKLPGHIYFRRKNHAVEAAFDIGGDAPRQVVYQKGVLRVYNQKINQITERNVEKSRADVDAFLSLGFGASGTDLTHDYDVKLAGWETMDGVKTAKLELSPKNEKLRNTYPRILLWIDPEKDTLLQQQFFESSGDYRLVHYTNMKLSNKLPDDKFRLKTTGDVTTVKAQ
jgi:outer membrane lipoprotein-sorting protein